MDYHSQYVLQCTIAVHDFGTYVFLICPPFVSQLVWRVVGRSTGVEEIGMAVQGCSAGDLFLLGGVFGFYSYEVTGEKGMV